MITFVAVPKRGDIVVKTIVGREVKYIAREGFVLSELNTSIYGVVGIVVSVIGGKVLVTYGNAGSFAWANRCWWYLSGYVLDNTTRSGVLSIRRSSDTWAANVNKTISYKASTLSAFVTALNNAFAADTDLAAQDWYADITSDNRVRVHCTLSDYRQISGNTASSGFSLTGAMPEIPALANMRRRHGGTGGEGAIINMGRALAYFTADNSSTLYNPASNVTSKKSAYPICLPGYLGTSAHQSDHCAALRAIYGSGEAGWRRFMESCLPVVPTDFGNMGQHDGNSMCKLLNSFSFTSRGHSVVTPFFPAAYLANTVNTSVIDTGEFWLPTTEELYRILDGVEYGLSGVGRDGDTLNHGLYLINRNAISNGSGLWSCARYSTYYAWRASGLYGFFYGSSMYGSSAVCPVALYDLR